MRKTWALLAEKSNWEEAFFVPCDSHGIQLLIKNICNIPWFAGVFKQSQEIVSYFFKANKQMSMLRRSQMIFYSRTYALSLSVSTRWGTQYRLITSLIRSKDALKHWANQDDPELDGDNEK